jgi:hypothetical protein
MEHYNHEESSGPMMFLDFDVGDPSQLSYDTCIGSPSHGENIDLDEEDPKKRPKWGHVSLGG